jgi:hypothetical protein
MIAPTDVIKLCDELEESLWALARSYAKDTDADGFDSVLDLTDAQLAKLKMMFRRDLGVVEGEPRHVLPKLTEVRKVFTRQPNSNDKEVAPRGFT